MPRPELCFVSEPGEARSLIDTLSAWGDDVKVALEDGRVFAAARRVKDPLFLVEPGTRIEIFGTRRPRGATEPEAFRILWKEDGLIAVVKPSGIATEPDHAGTSDSLVSRVASALSENPATLHALSRLDVGVSGVVLLATDSSARRGVTALRRDDRIKRRYVAIAAGVPSPASGTWSGVIGRRGSKRVVGGSNSESATTHYRVIKTLSGTLGHVTQASLIALEPVTGRTHQLRVHAAHAGAAFYGDGLYGGPKRVVRGDGAVSALTRVMLHAAWIELPFHGGLRIEAELAEELSETWRSLGGSDADWDVALGEW